MPDDEAPRERTAHEFLTVLTVDVAYLLGACAQAELRIDLDLVTRHREAVQWLAEHVPLPPPPPEPPEPEPGEPAEPPVEENHDERQNEGPAPEG